MFRNNLCAKRPLFNGLEENEAKNYESPYSVLTLELLHSHR